MKLFFSYNTDQIKIDHYSALVRNARALLSEYNQFKKHLSLSSNEWLKHQHACSPIIVESNKSYFDDIECCFPAQGSYSCKTILYESAFDDEFWKEQLFEKLLSLYNTLRRSDYVELRNLATEIKESIFDYTDSSLFNVVRMLSRFKETTEETIYKSVSTIKVLVARLRITFRRDLRMGYRNIVHFFFKNMDDNSGADTNTLYKNEMQTVLVNQQVNYNDTRRNNRIFRAAFG